MNRILRWGLSLALLAALCLSLAACGEKKTGGPEVIGPQTVTEEEQFEKTGIKLYPPVNAEVTGYVIIPMEGGVWMPEVNFTVDGVEWYLRAQATEATKPYDFSGISTEWVDECSWGYDDLSGSGWSSDDGCYLTWIKDGIAYTVCSTQSTEVFDACDMAYAIVDAEWFANYEEENDDPGEEVIVDVEPTAIDFVSGTWKYDDEDRYIRFLDNMTYTVYDVDCNAETSEIRFWRAADEESGATIVLLDADGQIADTMTVEGDLSNYDAYLVDGAGRTLSGWSYPMNGVYLSSLNNDYSLSDGNLFVYQTVECWVSNQVVAELDVGTLLDLHAYFDPIAVESVEKISDDEYLIGYLSNEVAEEITLLFDETANAWRAQNAGVVAYHLVGVIPLSDAMTFVDCGAGHETLEECLEKSGYVDALVTVDGDLVTAVEVVGVG